MMLVLINILRLLDVLAPRLQQVKVYVNESLLTVLLLLILLIII